MRFQFQKQSAFKLANRIITHFAVGLVPLIADVESAAGQNDLFLPCR